MWRLRRTLGDAHAVVAGTSATLTSIEPIALEDLERNVAPGDQVVLMKGFGQCPVSQFGKRFVSRLQKETEAIGLWRPRQLVGIEYTDRYLNSPLNMLLFLRTCETLASELRAGGELLEVDVCVQSLRCDRVPYRIFDDWDNEVDRADTANSLGEMFGLSVELTTTGHAEHGRKLGLKYADGQKVVILLDQGFGYWRVTGKPPRHEFRVSPERQARDMAQCSVPVSGTGESYFAITRE